MTELKPCPFCGGEHISLKRGLSANSHYAICSDCFAAGPMGTKKDAVELWNRRVNNETSL